DVAYALLSFFSSRRRHTRFSRDWSSDVCSSDLPRDTDGWLTTHDRGKLEGEHLFFLGRAHHVINCGGLKLSPDLLEAAVRERLEIGRESCRERGEITGGGAAFTRKAGTSRELMT